MYKYHLLIISLFFLTTFNLIYPRKSNADDTVTRVFMCDPSFSGLEEGTPGADSGGGFMSLIGLGSTDHANHYRAYTDGYEEGQAAHIAKIPFEERVAGGEFARGFRDGYYAQPYSSSKSSVDLGITFKYIQQCDDKPGSQYNGRVIRTEYRQSTPIYSNPQPISTPANKNPQPTSIPVNRNPSLPD
jgi:hypothetical protein